MGSKSARPCKASVRSERSEALLGQFAKAGVFSPPNYKFLFCLNARSFGRRSKRPLTPLCEPFSVSTWPVPFLESNHTKNSTSEDKRAFHNNERNFLARGCSERIARLPLHTLITCRSSPGTWACLKVQLLQALLFAERHSSVRVVRSPLQQHRKVRFRGWKN